MRNHATIVIAEAHCPACAGSGEQQGEPCGLCRPRAYHDPHAPTGAVAAYALLALVFLAGVIVGAML